MEIAMPYTQARYKQALLWYWLQQHRFKSDNTLLNDIVAYWKLDETSSTRFDSVGSNDLTDNGSVGSATGKIGNAASFDGTNYLQASNSTFADFSTESFSISLWLDASSSNTFAFNKRPGLSAPTREGYELLLVGGDIRFRIQGNVLGYEFLPVYSPPAGFAHIVVVVNRSTEKTQLYGNGILQNDDDISGMGSLSNSVAFSLASRDGGALMTGLIDEVGIWKRVLTPEEITDLYNSGSGLTYPFV
jgi:hypothetical protein